MSTFADRIAAATTETGSPLALGLDPAPSNIPLELTPSSRSRAAWVEAYRAYCLETLALCRPHTRITKIQIAFFEVLGTSGTQLFWECCHHAKQLGYVVIADVKRNDIGSTATAYAQSFLDHTQLPWETPEDYPDAITVTPLFGDDGNRPFLEAAERTGRGVFFLVRTSNPTSSQLQELRLHDGRTFDQATAELVAGYAENQHCSPGTSFGSVGAVVGATHPSQLETFRRTMPGVLLLLPGVGAQGADPASLRPAFDDRGQGAIVPVSRGILAAHCGRQTTGNERSTWQTSVSQAAARFATELRSMLFS